MSGKKGLLKGAKRRGKHTTVLSMTEKLIREAKQYAEVTGINPSRIYPKRGGAPRLTLHPNNGGWNIYVRGGGGTQLLIISSSDPEKTLHKLSAFWEKTAKGKVVVRKAATG